MSRKLAILLFPLFLAGHTAMADAARLYHIENENDAVILRRYAEPVAFPLSDADKTIIAQLREAANHYKGVGLAAPQIGYARQIILIEINEQAAAIRSSTTESLPQQIYINPSYEPLVSTSITEDWEGCFSVDSVIGKVPRFKSIRFKYRNLDGHWIEREVEGFHARVIQHEVDHIRGTLICDRLTKDHIHGSPEAMKAQRIAELNDNQREIIQQLYRHSPQPVKSERKGQ